MKHKNVSLFIQCIIDGMYPEVGEAMVRLLGNLGINMDYPPGQTCCGQPAFNAGYRREARDAAKHFIEVFDAAECIVCPSGSCVAMVRHHYPELFKDEPAWLERAITVGARTFELTEYLVDVLGVTDAGATYTGTVTYHDSCHLLRTLGIAEQPRTLIRNLGGVRFVEMRDSDRCCGFGGSFSIKYPQISTSMVTDKVQNILDSGADTVVGCDMGCLMNIQGFIHRRGYPVKVRHIAQLLAGEKE